MEFYQLKTFTMVAHEGNLTRAAKRLHASQPAVSAHIKALEDELEVTLFQRTPKGMVLTGAGEKLREHAERILTSIDEMVGEAGKLKGVLEGDIRIGINTEPTTLRVAELFSRMREEHPKLRIQLLQTMSGELLKKLERDELDAGFLYGENLSERIFVSELQQMRLVIAGTSDMQEALSRSEASELGQYPWVTTPEDCPFHTVSSAFFKKHRFKPDQVALVDDESIIKAMVKNGAGLSLLLRQEASADEDLALWDKEELNLPLSIACLQRRKDEPLLQTLFSMLSKIWDASSRV